MEFLVFWLICGAVCAVMADNRGRSKIGWFFAGLVFGIFAIIALAIAGKKTEPAV